MAVYPLQPSLQTVDPLQFASTVNPHRDRQIVEGLQLYSTLQSTALQRSTVYILYIPPQTVGRWLRLPYPQNNRASGSYTVHCGP